MLKEIIKSLEVNSFKNLKKYLNEYLVFYSDTSLDERDKNLIIEKLYDYIATFKLVNKVKDDEIYKEYSNTLYSFFNIKQSKETKRINKYLDKLKEVKNILSKNKTTTLDDLKDFTRVFLCLYTMQIKKDKNYTDEDFSFDLNSIEFNDVVKSLETHKKANQLYSEQKYSIILLVIIYFGILNDHGQGD